MVPEQEAECIYSQDRDSDFITKIIGEQFPELIPASVKYLGEGCDSCAFEVNSTWVFRFPKRRETENQLLVEISTLPALVTHLPIPIPVFCFHGCPSANFPYHFVGYRKISGQPAMQLGAPPAPLVSTLSLFLSRLHAFSVTEASRLGVRTKEAGVLLEEFRAEALARFDLLHHVAPEAYLDQWHAYLKDRIPQISGSPWPQTLLHSDVVAEHVLLDPVTQEVTGIIDWGDIAIGDPVADFAGLFHWGGEQFVKTVLSTYMGPVDERVLPHARYLAACKGVHSVAFGVDTKQVEYIAAGLRALQFAAS